MSDQKPQTTWQSYDSQKNILTVHVSNDPASEVYFEGLPEDYDGTATYPASPTGLYLEKQRRLAEEPGEEVKPEETTGVATETETAAE